MADVSSLRPDLGDRIPTVSHTVDQATIDAWSQLSGDVNPLHIDVEYARATRFGGTIAHGHLLLTWLCEALLSWRGPGWLAGGALADIRFVGPVRPGETVRVEGEVVDISEERREATCDLRLVLATEGRPCVIGKALLPWEERKR